ncbi:MAG: phosphatidylserine decarboxylase [Lachnospiraceae bacterium]|nr:phosphatidylserine decarboxylase [Lachnospiraceae bacterium]
MSEESLSILFLYRTVPGRMLLKLLVNPGVSKAAAHVMSSSVSKLFIPAFVRKNHIDMNKYEEPSGGYRSFNDFFTRKQKPEYVRKYEGGVISPCDGLLTVFDINDDSVFEIKNSKYSVRGLLRDKKLSGRFAGGTACIFRLTPSHYHRYCYPTDGKVYADRRINGELHCVRPVALETFKVFTQNSREYSILKSDEYGSIIQMEVGAMLVGKITNRHSAEKSYNVSGGEEKGYFEYGGSTIILLFENRIELCDDIMNREPVNGEIPVKIGEKLF